MTNLLGLKTGQMMKRARLSIAFTCALSLILMAAPIGASAQGQSGDAKKIVAAEVNFSEVLRVQRRMLLTQARALSPQRPGVTDLYFIAFGGEARQDVFLSEVRFARNLFDRRFDTKGRSIVMANNLQTVHELPLASMENLRIALNFVSKTIDREEDVVFLFITSHGSQTHELSVEMPPLALDNITVPALRKLMDQSKIKWRVIVISACYSGGFVEDLSNEQTLMITAARADRTSFGCTNTARFTYFGRAYFAEALILEYSFVRAFRMARNTLERLERQQGFPQSFPQIQIGSAIEAKLSEIELRLDGTARFTAN